MTVVFTFYLFSNLSMGRSNLSKNSFISDPILDIIWSNLFFIKSFFLFHDQNKSLIFGYIFLSPETIIIDTNKNDIHKSKVLNNDWEKCTQSVLRTETINWFYIHQNNIENTNVYVIRSISRLAMTCRLIHSIKSIDWHVTCDNAVLIDQSIVVAW